MEAFSQILQRLKTLEYEQRSRDYSTESAVIVAVNDPKNMGRVKVQYDSGIVSDWIGVVGSSRGQLSSQFIGSRCVISKLDGASNRELVMGITSSDPESSIISDPIQVPILSEQANAYNRLFPEETGDRGIKCNEGNAGRLYVFSNEMHMTPSICLRVNNFQETKSNTPTWNWVPLKAPRIVEKGFTKGVEDNPAYVPLSTKGPGIPECNQAMDGQRYVFSEDRTYRTYEIICLRDENEQYTWKPVGAPPTIFRTNLPTCTEKMHGVQFIYDDGNNSELVTCQRYQGNMTWVKPTRDPIIPVAGAFLDKISFLTTFNPVPEIVGFGSGLGLLAGIPGGSFLSTALGTVSIVSPLGPLGLALTNPQFLSQAFNIAEGIVSGDTDIFSNIQTLATNFGGLERLGEMAELGDFSNAANLIDPERAFELKGTEILNTAFNQSGQSGLSIDNFLSDAARASTSDSVASVYGAWGDEGSGVFTNIINSNVTNPVSTLGQYAYQSALSNLDSQDRGIHMAAITDGIRGAIDASTIANRPLAEEYANSLRDIGGYLGGYSGLSSLPSTVSQFVTGVNNSFRERTR
jgi:hypothetical protein